jgi:hypothetical protein
MTKIMKLLNRLLGPAPTRGVPFVRPDAKAKTVSKSKTKPKSKAKPPYNMG